MFFRAWGCAQSERLAPAGWLSGLKMELPMTNRALKRLVAYATVGVLGAGITFVAMRARAAGIPNAAALTYTGYLENPDGTPVTGTKGIGIALYDAETDGNEVCVQKPADVEPIAGRFQVTLPDKCSEAVKANREL